MWAYFKSFLYKNDSNNEKTNTKKRKLSLKEKSMITRHRTNSKLKNKNLKWSNAGWSQRHVTHTDWSIKLKNDITLPIIESQRRTTKLISAKKIPINMKNETITLQKYIENYGVYNPDVKINFNLSLNFNESIESGCCVVIIPTDKELIHQPTKLTHRFEQSEFKNLLVVSTPNKTTSLIESSRRHNLNLEDKLVSDKVGDIFYNICVEIPLVKSRVLNDTFMRNSTKHIKGTIVYYLYIDHEEINESDLNKIDTIFKNFEKEKYDLLTSK